MINEESKERFQCHGAFYIVIVSLFHLKINELHGRNVFTQALCDIHIALEREQTEKFQYAGTPERLHSLINSFFPITFPSRCSLALPRSSPDFTPGNVTASLFFSVSLR